MEGREGGKGRKEERRGGMKGKGREGRKGGEGGEGGKEEGEERREDRGGRERGEGRKEVAPGSPCCSWYPNSLLHCCGSSALCPRTDKPRERTTCLGDWPIGQMASKLNKKTKSDVL